MSAKVILIIGGVFQVALGLFHILLGRAIQLGTTMDLDEKALFHMLNVAGTIMVFFFAYVSFFNQKELLTTRLGKSVLVFIMLIYFSRALEEFIFPGFDVIIFSLCVFVGLLYLFVPFIPGQKQVTPA